MDEKKNNYIASIYIDNNCAAIAWADVSTGEFNCFELSSNKVLIEDMLVTINPAEIITNSVSFHIVSEIPSIRMGRLPKPYNYIDSAYNYGNAYKKLLDSFKTQSLQIFECEGNKPIVSVAGSLMEYISDTQKRALCHINGLKLIKNNNFMFLDTATRRNLEITQNSRDSKRYGSLLWVIDKTKTSMGARMLRNWMDQPLINSKKINARLDGVESLINNNPLRTELVESLKQIKDIERIVSKVAYKSVNPKELRTLGESLAILPQIKAALKTENSRILTKIYNNIDEMRDVSELLLKAIKSDCKTLLREGDFIADGFNVDLDNLRNARANGREILAKIEAEEKASTGIKNLKVGYNKVFGYYIEVTNSSKEKVPYRYVRKQTLANAERYITEELKQVEDMVLGADEKALALELKIFDEIIAVIKENTSALKISANAVAQLDTLISFAEVSLENNYCKPIISTDLDSISIIKGRHPVVEKIIGLNQFVPNDFIIDKKENRTMIITGPNMAGKSTYM